METTFSWITSDKINDEHKTIRVNQVYVWIFTYDNKLILVSKDGHKWQFPGGHPQLDEVPTETATREVLEETGVDISDKISNLRFFGYYLVSEPNSDRTSLVNILQLRFLLKLDISNQNLVFKPQEKDTEAETAKVHFVKAFSIEEACEIIPWLAKTDELQAFKAIIQNI